MYQPVGGGFTWRNDPNVMNNSPWGVPNIRKWSNVDIWDTLNDPFVDGLEKRKVDQNDVNDHLFTALLTLECEINKLHRELDGLKAHLALLL